MEALFINFVFFFVGAIITWFFSWFYYRKAGSESNIQYKKIIRGLEQLGAKFVYDEKGNLKDIFLGEAKISLGTIRIKAEPTLITRSTKRKDEHFE